MTTDHLRIRPPAARSKTSAAVNSGATRTSPANTGDRTPKTSSTSATGKTAASGQTGKTAGAKIGGRTADLRNGPAAPLPASPLYQTALRDPSQRPAHVPPVRTAADTPSVPMLRADFLKELWVGREVRCNWRGRDAEAQIDAPHGHLRRCVSRVSTTAVYLRSNDTESYLPLPTSTNDVRVYRTPTGFLYVGGDVRLRYRWA